VEAGVTRRRWTCRWCQTHNRASDRTCEICGRDETEQPMTDHEIEELRAWQ
jgi:hypothetical protein